MKKEDQAIEAVELLVKEEIDSTGWDWNCPCLWCSNYI